MQDNDNTFPEAVDDGPVPTDAPVLDDQSEVLMRHIRRAWYDNGVASSQNFEPMPKDRSHLSVERGSMIDPVSAFQRWTGWGRDSVAVYGVGVGFYKENAAPCFHVPVVDAGQENPEHALVRYPEGRSQASKLARKAKKDAKSIFQP